MKEIVVAFFLISSPVFAGNGFLENKTIIGCENQGGYPPFVFENKSSGKLEGYSVDLLNLIFKNSGARVRYELLPWKRCMEYMGRGEVMDLVLAAASTEERRKKYIFSDAFAEVNLAYFYDHQRYPKGLHIKKPSDLDDLETVCGMRGFIYEGYRLSKKVWQEADNFQQLIDQVINKRCDAILVRYEVFKSLPKAIHNLIHYDRMKGGIIPWRKNNPIRFYFLAKKNSIYHKNLIDFINNKMKQIRKSGQFRSIKEKYGFSVD